MRSQTPIAPSDTDVSSMSSVRVAVRVRPLLSKEKLEKNVECVTVDKSIEQVNVGNTRGYRFDYAFDKDTKQETIYNTCVNPLVESIFQGYNATVLAYGQTGSGKTHTMGTSNYSSFDSEEAGIIPRVIRHIFDKIDESTREEVEYMVRVSYYEIYNENVKDLLNPDTPSKSLVVREDENRGIVINSIKEEVVTSYEEMIKCVETGSIHRTVGCTLMNETSSRSHSIFTIILEQRISSVKTGGEPNPTGEEYKLAKFHLVDLAGSERNKRTGAAGIRFKEAIQINAGLLALGNVISALGDEKKRGSITHVPYRDSKLTRLLQDSLGGNSRTVMIACVSPADSNFQETLNTLKYANRARNIKNKPVVNTDPHSAQLARLKDQISALQLELLKQKLQQGESSFTLEELLQNETTKKHLLELQNKTVGHSEYSAEFHRVQQENTSLTTENSKLNFELEKATQALSKLSADSTYVQSDRDKYYHALRSLKNDLQVIVQTIKSLQAHLQLTTDQQNALKEIIRKLDDWSQWEKAPPLVRTSSAPINLTVSDSSSSLKTLANSKRMSSLSNTASSTPRSGNDVVLPKKEYLEMQKELKEAKEDLNRDEKIFSEKMREIKKLSKANLELKKENLTLKSTIDAEHRRVTELELRLNGQVPPNNNPKPDSKPDSTSDVEVEPNQTPQHLSNVSADDIVKIEAEMQALELEKQKILEEKNSIEEQKLLMEQQVREQQRTFLRNRRKMEKNLKDLTIMIRLKEELIRDLMKSDTESQVIKQQYEQKIQKMETEVHSTQQEMEKLVRDLEAADMDKANKENEKQRILAEYESKLKKKNQQLSELKKKQLDSERLIKEKYQSDKRVRELENEINKMKAQQDYLKRKIKEESDRQSDQCNSQSKQISDLRKEAENSNKRIRELENENNKQKLILRRKADEIQRAQALLSRYKTNRDRSVSTDIDKQRAWLDREIEKYLKKKETMELLEKELKRRETIIKEKENMIATRNQIEEQKMRSSQVMHQGINGLKNQIDQLEKQITEREIELKNKKVINSSNSLKSEAKAILSLTEEIRLLKEKRERALNQKAVLEEKARKQEVAEEEVLREIEERTEVLDAEIEFKNEAIAQAEREIHEDNSSVSLAFNEVTDLMEAKNMLKKYFEKVIELKEEEQRKESKLQQMDVVMQERDKIIENLQNNVRLTEMVYERKLTKQQKENELKIQYLLKQISSLQEKNASLSNSNTQQHQRPKSDEDNITEDGIDRIKVESMIRLKDDQIQMLDKDNFYYKQTNKDLKRKLRDLRAKTESHQTEVLSLKRENSTLLEENEKISQELKNIKAYLFKHTGVVQQVRRSIKSIKEIRTEDVEQRSEQRRSQLNSSLIEPTDQQELPLENEEERT